MGTVIGIFIVVLMVLWILTKLVNSVSKSAQKIQHKDRCQGCGSRLKAVDGKYMPTCRRCGNVQDWATA